jgi:RHS repeat-associated protein
MPEPYLWKRALGSIRGLTDEQGRPIIGYDYDPFGVATRSSGTSANPLRYTGQYLDNATGLYYLRARYYEPSLGRFLQRDTIVPDLYNSQAINRYSFALNNPVKYVDPDGHWVQIVIGAAAGGIIAYGVQVVGNVQDGGFSTQAFTNVSWQQVGAGVVAGGVGTATFAASLAVAGAATGVSVASASAASIGVAAVAGVASGRAAQVAENAVFGQPLATGLWDPGSIAIDAVSGGAGPALRAARGQVAPFVQGRIIRRLGQSMEDLTGDSCFLAKSPSLQGTDIHTLTATRMRAENIPGLDVEHRFLDPATGKLLGKVDYRFRPERVLYDIKPEGADFPRAEQYLEWSGYDRLVRIDYDPWWR